MLRALHLKDVGPAACFDLELGEQLNVLTGDNGLGKSFMLEVAWWALTGTWMDRPVLPQRGKEESAEIAGEILRSEQKWYRGEGQASRPGTFTFKSRFNRVTQRWDGPFSWSMHNSWVRPTEADVEMPAWLEEACPVLYIRTNGSFALWDPARVHVSKDANHRQILEPEPYRFEEKDLWDGLTRDGNLLCNGLIRDWVTWQLEAEAEDSEDHPFHLLRRVLEQLSHPEEPMTPGKPVRLYLDDVRKFPTVDLPYESIPVVHASAGMKRILGLSYVITWMWTEHVQASRMIGWEPAQQIVVLMEEPETHLHPKWQRHIVPALLGVLSGLSTTMRPQVLFTTHAPLVLASLEPYFDIEKDKLFNFELRDRVVVLDEVPWTRYGDALAWLTSGIFDLKEGRSVEAERAIGAAYDFMANRPERLPPDLQTADAIHEALQRLLADQDPFWPQWLFERQRRSA